jgi:predicted dithiol-disulfide oxidoreductase (DUF899 family)
MCPACLATMASIVAGATSTGGVVGLVVHKVSRRRGVAPLREERETKEKKMPTVKSENRTLSAVVSREEWLAARKELLAREKEFTRQRDALSAARRKLPMVKIDKDYVFEGPNGRTNLLGLFGRHPQLIVYHFMFEPNWDAGCPRCSMFADNFCGAILHLPARNTAFACVSLAPVTKIETFKKRMGWTFPWYSSSGSSFNRDFQVSVDTSTDDQYNYASAAELKKAGRIWTEKGELPGLSVFLRDGDGIFHTYSTYQRGLDLLLNTYNYLDLTPLGRQEEDGIMRWVRHHDKYTA